MAAGRDAIVNVATPKVTVCEEASVKPPSLKVTVPVAPLLESVAVNVIDVPPITFVDVVVSAVVVGTSVIVCVIVLDVKLIKFVSPLYTAVIE